MLKRTWQWVRRPSRMAWSLIFAGGIAAGIVGWGGFHYAMKSTNNMEYCVSCHEMEIPFAEYKETAHFRNQSGIQANCTDCHVPKEPWGAYVMTKIIATKDLYHHYMGTIDTPEKYEERRLHMAQMVWDRMQANDSRTCRSCHDFDTMIISEQSERAQEEHPKAMAEGNTCIDCHKGIAHTLPDMRQAFAAAFQDLKEQSADAELETAAYALETMPFFMEKDGERPAGKLLPATRLEVLAKDGDWLRARVSGWRQEGADPVMYGAIGQRILTAAMTKPAAEAVEQGEAQVVEGTGQTWFPVSLEVWVPQDNLAGSIDPVWDYAGSLYRADCAVCHPAHHTDQFLANQWIGQLKAMERFSQLNKDQNRLVLKYLQYHAKDAPDAPGMM
ncbi:NapC/NirT family cytochrome c [Roseospira navarrensis]|uniref:Cytochrome c-type protein n=1 Tax=Roseospira navarrensis TaxID=140058 RepID=A0A7X1ZGT3_9PROT|nr:NapC/NirT family cytochrome c [Roseospira navarrensis]MQX38195.1 cytochrome C [Roseospira navarrensis]